MFTDGEPIDSVINYDDAYKNEWGAIRRIFVKDAYDFGEIKEEAVLDLFQLWKDDPEYFILKGNKTYFVPRITTDDHDLYEIPVDGEIRYKTVFKFIKASKRGNDVYQYLVKEKLRPLNQLPDVLFFRDKWGVKSTSLLFITLTYDGKLSNEENAWDKIGKQYHLFINNLKKQYGRIEFFRTWESTKSFYPHVHCLIAFRDNTFQVFKKIDNKGKTKYRISDAEKKKISGYWHSHVDIQGCSNTEDAIKELTKYVSKDLCSKKGNITNSMIWLFNKQAYAISKRFVKVVSNSFADFKIDDVKPTDLIKSEMCNWNQDVEKWEFVGILRGCFLGFGKDVWVVDCEDPPPKIKKLIDFEADRWACVYGGR